MKVKEACLISIVNQLIESDLLERQKQAKSQKQLYQMAKILDINTGRDSMMSRNVPWFCWWGPVVNPWLGPEPTDKEDLEAEINRLNLIIEKQNSDLSNENEKYQCNICQEKVITNCIAFKWRNLFLNFAFLVW